MSSKLGIVIATFIFGLALNAFRKRALQMSPYMYRYIDDPCRSKYTQIYVYIHRHIYIYLPASIWDASSYASEAPIYKYIYIYI